MNPAERHVFPVGLALAVAGSVMFSAKAIVVKLAYRHGVDAETLLALRMLVSAPFFAAALWWTSRGAARLSRRDHALLVTIGMLGYYLASYFDFLGLQHISAALERLILYLNPTLVLLLSVLVLGRPVTRFDLVALLLSYGGIVFVFWHDLSVAGDAGAVVTGGALVFGSAFCYALYLVGAGDLIGRMGSTRFIALAMLASTVFVLAQFALTRPLAALQVPMSIHALSLAMAVFSTVLPTWMVAEAIRRIGANGTSLIGSLGPVFTIGMGAVILGEPLHAVQLLGAALVLAGVLLVTRRPRTTAAAEAD